MRKFILLSSFILILNVSKSQEIYPFLASDNKWGFVDQNLEIVIKPVFDYAHPFIENTAAVEMNGSWGFITKSGKSITKIEYIDLKETSEGLIPVCNRNGKWGFINLDGKTEIPFIYNDVYPFNHGLAPVYLNGLYGFINNQGSICIKEQFIYVSEFNKDGFSHVLVSFNEGYIIDT